MHRIPGDGGRAGPVLASACLLGVRCRYDGTSRERPELLARLAAESVIPVCPEQLGGLPTPRPPCRLEWSDVAKPSSATGEDVLAGRALVVDDGGADRTAEFLRGAAETLSIARALGARRAFLKAGSPSCDERAGVTAARLRTAGIDVVRIE